MPKFCYLLPILSLKVATLLVTVFCILRTPVSIHAATDPLSATVSATAKVPNTAPTTTDTTPPTPVILVSPHDGAVTNNSRPEFIWKTTIDSNSNFLTYTLYLNGVATYLGVSNTGNSQQNNYVAHIGDGNIYLTPSLDLPTGHYNWYVKATDGSNNSSYSATWHFSIDQTPPFLTLTNIDDTYDLPTISEDSIFDLPGPKSVKLSFSTESYATVTLNITPDGESIKTYVLPSDHTGNVSLSVSLPLGLTSIVATSYDSAGLTTVLPLFYLRLSPTSVTGFLPPLNLPHISSLPYNLVTNLNLPVAISQIQDRKMIAIYPYIMLAIILLIMIIIIWNKKSNILILDRNTHKPYRSLIIYHSRPTHSAKIKPFYSALYLTNQEPQLYRSGIQGRLYIDNLAYGSSLTIRTPDGLTHLLSISKNLSFYKLLI